jgi:anthranilate phosphoribosyltransferase
MQSPDDNPGLQVALAHHHLDMERPLADLKVMASIVAHLIDHVLDGDERERADQAVWAAVRLKAMANDLFGRWRQRVEAATETMNEGGA